MNNVHNNEMYEQVIEDINGIVNPKTKADIKIPTYWYEGREFELTSRETNTNEGFKNAIDDDVEFIILYGPRAQNYISKLKRKKFINKHKVGITLVTSAVGFVTGGVAVAVGAGIAAIFAGVNAKKLANYSYEVLGTDIVTFKIKDEEIEARCKSIVDAEKAEAEKK